MPGSLPQCWAMIPKTKALPAVRSGHFHRRTLAPVVPPKPESYRRCEASSGSEPSTSGRDAGAAPAAARTPQPRPPYLPIAVLASTGFLETAYLTASKLAGASVACPLSGGCASVLTSDYASFMGVIPLSALGALAYAGVAALAAKGLAVAKAGDEDAEAALHVPILAGGLLLASTSAYLMHVLLSKFPGDMCPYCIGSAGLSFFIAALVASGLRSRELVDAAAPGAGLVAATILVLSLGLGNADLPLARAGGVTELEYRQPAVTTQSSPEAIALAARLRNAGATMYGAFWCSHCYEQKLTFGKEAMMMVPYEECFPDGWRQGVEMAPACKAAGLQGFPTWVVGGEKLEGDQTFEALAAALDRAEAAAVRS